MTHIRQFLGECFNLGLFCFGWGLFVFGVLNAVFSFLDALLSSGCRTLGEFPARITLASLFASALLGFLGRSKRLPRASFVFLLAWLFLTAVHVARERANPSPTLNEGHVIGTLRSFLSAQNTWASMNEGYFEGRFDCLYEPRRCLPDYPEDAPRFLGTDLSANPAYYRYAFALAAVPAVVRHRQRAPNSPSSVIAFALTAVRSERVSGVRNYCADSRGFICYRLGDEVPVVKDGQCLECELLE